MKRALKISQNITNRAREGVMLEKYFADVSKFEMLTLDEEIVLARRIRIDKDEAAIQKLVQANLRFVISVAKQYYNNNFSLLDLINEGNLGLLKAAEKFDETRGFKFISYAVWWIRQSIMQAISENSRIVRLPLNRNAQINKIKNEISHFEQINNREPTAEELEETLELGEDCIKTTLSLIHGGKVSFDKPMSDKDGASDLYSVIADTSPATDHEIEYTDSLHTTIMGVLNLLSTKEKDILMLHYGFVDGYEYGLSDIADRLDLSRERVRQIKEKAIKKLRNESKSNLLKEFCAQ